MRVGSAELYLRQAAIPMVGPEGLTKLRNCSVAIAGAGGVGSSAAYYLARSGVGRIRLIDQDVIEPSNLQRIHSATEDDLYHPKAEILAQRLSKFESSSRIQAVVDTITPSNVDDLLGGVDVILDGLDNFRTRYILNRFAVRTKTPYLFISAVAQQAHLALLNPPKTPCLECIMPGVADRFEDSCETLGVTTTITGLAGAIGADTIIQSALGIECRLKHQLLTIDMEGPEFLFSNTSRKKSCVACNSPPERGSQEAPAVTLLCGEHTANALPPHRMRVQLAKVRETLHRTEILAESNSVLVYRQAPYTISLFRDGRILIGGIGSELLATKIAREIWQTLGE